MISSYVVVILRNLSKNKLFVLINIAGLGLAVALCIIAYLTWDFHERWDAQHVNAEKIYRIQFWYDRHNGRDPYGSVPMPLAEHVRENVKDVEKVARYLPTLNSFRIGEEVFRSSIAYADSTFLQMFSFPIIHGTADGIKDPASILISDHIAQVYFKRTDVVGEEVTQINNGVLKQYRVAAVFRKSPKNSSFGFDILTAWDNVSDAGMRPEDWRQWNTCFVSVTEKEKIPLITASLRQYVEPQNRAREDFKISEYYLEPFLGLGKRSSEEPRVKGNHLGIAAPRTIVVVPVIMAILLLLLACFNFTNTAIALSSQRLKEIGIRKVMGGVRSQLVVQFLGENFFLCFLGLLAGLVFAEFLVPAYDDLWSWLDLDLSYSDNLGFLVFLAGLLFLTAIIAGGYSAFYITAFHPITILKGKTKFGGTNWLTRFLLGTQFAISILTIISAVAFYRNAIYQKNYDLGYLTSGVIAIHVKNEAGFNMLRDAISHNREIQSIAGTRNHIQNTFFRSSIHFEDQKRETDVMEVGDNYLEAMHIKLLSGRGFNRDSENDRRESVLVSEEFVRQFNWTDNPVGKRLVWRDTAQLFVIGVIRDVYSRALFRPVEPMMLRYVGPENYTQLVVRTSPKHISSVNEFLRDKWRDVFPGEVFAGEFIETKMRETLEINNNGVIIFGFIGVFAALMSATGLYTLISLHILKRMKEIGVRKVLGASFTNLLHVISFEFTLIIAIGSVIGGIGAYYLMDISMDSAWEYYEKVNLKTFASAIVIVLVLSVLTVGYKTINTARMNPVKTLRDD